MALRLVLFRSNLEVNIIIARINTAISVYNLVYVMLIVFNNVLHIFVDHVLGSVAMLPTNDCPEYPLKGKELKTISRELLHPA